MLTGKSVVVTGASSAIGATLAVALVERGASVVFADIDEDGACQVAAAPGPGDANAEPVNVIVATAIKRLLEGVVDRKGQLDDSDCMEAGRAVIPLGRVPLARHCAPERGNGCRLNEDRSFLPSTQSRSSLTSRSVEEFPGRVGVASMASRLVYRMKQNPAGTDKRLRRRNL